MPASASGAGPHAFRGVAERPVGRLGGRLPVGIRPLPAHRRTGAGRLPPDAGRGHTGGQAGGGGSGACRDRRRPDPGRGGAGGKGLRSASRCGESAAQGIPLLLLLGQRRHSRKHRQSPGIRQAGRIPNLHDLLHRLRPEPGSLPLSKGPLPPGHPGSAADRPQDHGCRPDSGDSITTTTRPSDRIPISLPDPILA